MPLKKHYLEALCAKLSTHRVGDEGGGDLSSALGFSGRDGSSFNAHSWTKQCHVDDKNQLGALLHQIADIRVPAQKVLQYSS